VPIRTKMLPHGEWSGGGRSGIHTIVKNYFKYLPDFGIELVAPDATDFDVLAIHAGSLDVAPPKNIPIVSHLHGIYFTADYKTSGSEHKANRRIVNILHYAKEVTVPSHWVAETFQRDMRFTPHVVGHGVNWQEWQHNYTPAGYVLAYAKNRAGSDVCDNSFVPRLAQQFPDITFVATLAPKGSPSNVVSLDGTIPYEEMQRVIQEASIVMSPVKETFGLLTLEAMAAGKPILGINKGGNVDLVQHGGNGYLYDDSLEDMCQGLNYCFTHADVLGKNSRELARQYTWESACEQVASIYAKAMIREPATVSVVIPVFNKPVEQVERAIESVRVQTYSDITDIIVVDDGSDNGRELKQVIGEITDNRIVYQRQHNQGVADARNNGIAATGTKYICALDADDWLDPRFLEVCVNALEADSSLSLAFTGLTSHEPDGKVQLSPGNPAWDYDKMIDGLNTVWTCNVFRRDMWKRLGGYRARYCPSGAGEEDAELWLRAGAYGFRAKKVTDEGLFHYSWKTGQVTGSKSHRMTDYRAWHPWVKDDLHPLASYATPANKVAHPVRQYDEPIVSVIIPVGPGHERSVIDALDSLEAQRFRRWEAIVVYDNEPPDEDVPVGFYPNNLKKAYPYVKTIEYRPSRGTGFARNRGVEIARAPLILFLDADDTLRPIDALEKMLEYWNTYQAAIYTDYVGQAYIDDEGAAKLQERRQLESYDPKTGEAIIVYPRGEYDCERAQKQPTTLDDAYNWNVVTTLLPKDWHFEIGGFDQSMSTLEDWDYWLRLAKRGKCFKHLPETLVRYRLRAGDRHVELGSESGRQKAQVMLEYMKEKHEGLEIMPCRGGCGGGKRSMTNTQQATMTMNDEDFVKAVYLGPQGNHHIIGAYEFSAKPETLPSRPTGRGWKLYYGYGDNGHIAFVHRQDVALMPGKWKIVEEVVATKPVTEVSHRPMPTAPVETSLEKLARLRENAAQQTATMLAEQKQVEAAVVEPEPPKKRARRTKRK
jgi:glycosyltransferase involved in cell wall biosynthesis